MKAIKLCKKVTDELNLLLCLDVDGGSFGAILSKSLINRFGLSVLPGLVDPLSQNQDSSVELSKSKHQMRRQSAFCHPSSSYLPVRIYTPGAPLSSFTSDNFIFENSVEYLVEVT